MSIAYDQNSFIVDGKRVFMNSAAIHYFRMPRQEWREVLLKAKLAGMNCIDTYFAWNLHEKEEGRFNFEDELDVGYFMDLCMELGLWVIARPGPFICAEWDFGGHPWWLTQKPDMEYRIDNLNYLKAISLYFDKLLPIIAQRQITNGGPVILVQVENEYGYLAESERGKNYMNQLRDSILVRHINVPLITCVGGAEDTIECANFWTGAQKHYDRLVEKQSHTPKIVTEFWTGWFEHWGGMAALQKTPMLYEKKLLEVIAAGFDGINHYMFFGGTNFESYGGRTVGGSDIFMVSSYDYDAPLNEYGRITDKYYVAKKFSQFTNVLASFLLSAKASDATSIVKSNGINLSSLEADKGQRLLFAENMEAERNSFFVSLQNDELLPIVVEAGQMLPVLDRIFVSDHLRLSVGGYLIANEHYENRQVMMIAGGKGQRLTVLLEVDSVDEEHLMHSLVWDDEESRRIRHKWLIEHKTLMLDLYLFEEAQLFHLKLGERLIELIVLNETAAQQAWYLEGTNPSWVIGFKDINVTIDYTFEGLHSEAIYPVCINQDSTFIMNDMKSGVNSPSAPNLEKWKTKYIPLHYEQNFDAVSPQGFSAFNQDYGYLLYSHEHISEADYETVLAFTGIQDPVRVFINGIEQGLIKDLGATGFKVKLTNGKNTVQLLTQHMGRLNFSPYLGEEKGIFGAIYRNAQIYDFRHNWLLEEEQISLCDMTIRQDQPMISKSFFVDGNMRVLLVGVLSEILIINGTKVEMEGYSNWFHFNSIDITSYMQEGTNKIEMQLVQIPTSRLELIVCDEGNQLNNWSIRDLFEHRGESEELDSISHMISAFTPAQHTTTFHWNNDLSLAHEKLKLRMTNMSKGFITLNGRLLCRYWQVGPQEDYKIPIAWLNEGENKLEIFDELGLLPQLVKLMFDQQQPMTWTKIVN